MKNVIDVLDKVEKDYIEASCLRVKIAVKLETVHALGGNKELIDGYNAALESAVKLEEKSKKLWVDVLEALEESK